MAMALGSTLWKRKPVANHVAFMVTVCHRLSAGKGGGLDISTVKVALMNRSMLCCLDRQQ
jgi:hypothetical protein